MNVFGRFKAAFVGERTAPPTSGLTSDRAFQLRVYELTEAWRKRGGIRTGATYAAGLEIRIRELEEENRALRVQLANLGVRPTARVGGETLVRTGYR